MKYFGHDSNAGDDTKLESVILEFGMAGYGIYFRCCEFIASKVSEFNQSCVLEQTLRILSDRFKMPQDDVKKILDYFVEIGLFDISPDGQYRNLKLLKRLDRYTENRVRQMNKGNSKSVYTKNTHSVHKVDVKEKKRKENNIINSSSTKDSATKDKSKDQDTTPHLEPSIRE